KTSGAGEMYRTFALRDIWPRILCSFENSRATSVSTAFLFLQRPESKASASAPRWLGDGSTRSLRQNHVFYIRRWVRSSPILRSRLTSTIANLSAAFFQAMRRSSQVRARRWRRAAWSDGFKGDVNLGIARWDSEVFWRTPLRPLLTKTSTGFSSIAKA